MINLLKDLVSKLIILLITILIITKITKTNIPKIYKNQKSVIIPLINPIETNNQTKENKEEVINNLVEKLNAHIDEQAYLLSYYMENELDEKKLQNVQTNIAEIKKDASNKKIIHLIDMTQLHELEKQLYIYNQTLKSNNKS
ncbi:MAG: hypothetical protein ABIA74_02750 [bacterium]